MRSHRNPSPANHGAEPYTARTRHVQLFRAGIPGLLPSGCACSVERNIRTYVAHSWMVFNLPMTFGGLILSSAERFSRRNNLLVAMKGRCYHALKTADYVSVW